MSKPLSEIAVLPIRAYQFVSHPVYHLLSKVGVPRLCRFEPSCSDYAIESIRKYGIIRGGLKGLSRVIRCNPHSHGGYDPVD